MSRPANAVVKVNGGDLANALRLLRGQLQRNGTRASMARHEEYVKPGERRRLKRLKAARRRYRYRRAWISPELFARLKLEDRED